MVGSKGRGSNMAALALACRDPEFPAEIVAVISPKDETPAVERARSMGLEVEIASTKEPGYEELLTVLLVHYRVEWICLAGLMTKLPSNLVETYAGRILNIHPALLPKFGGKGMYGMHVHEAVIAAGEVESGCSVHIVTEEYDEGPVVLQKHCPVFRDDTAESLAVRVLGLENAAYPEALRMVIEGSQVGN